MGGSTQPSRRPAMTDSIWPTIHAERQALADDLDRAHRRTVGHAFAMPGLGRPRRPGPPGVGGQDDAGAIREQVRRRRFQFRQVRRQTGGGRRSRRSGGNVGGLPRGVAPRERAARSDGLLARGGVRTWRRTSAGHSASSPAIRFTFVARTVAFYAKSNAIIGGRDRVAGVDAHGDRHRLLRRLRSTRRRSGDQLAAGCVRPEVRPGRTLRSRCSDVTTATLIQLRLLRRVIISLAPNRGV